MADAKTAAKTAGSRQPLPPSIPNYVVKSPTPLPQRPVPQRPLPPLQSHQED